jgi:hypothetical protein
MAHQQGEFYSEPLLCDRPTAPGFRTPDAVFHRVEVHGEFFGRQLVTAAAAEEYPQRLAQSLVVLGIGRQITGTPSTHSRA